MNSQMFNSKVSIITKSEIRYEGTLFQVNPQQQNLALKDVRSFGTEGRRPDHEIAAVSHTYDVIVFRAQEIKELKVIQPESSTPTPQPPKQPQPPQQQQQPPQQQQNYHRQEPQIRESPYSEKLPTSSNNSTNSRAFDFDEMMTKINEIEKAKVSSESTKPKYKKKDFFDQMSSTVTEKKSNQKVMTREERQHQNQVDTDTFGNFYKQRKPYQKYNNNNNNNNNGGNKKQWRRPGPRGGQQIMYVEKKQDDHNQQFNQ